MAAVCSLYAQPRGQRQGNRNNNNKQWIPNDRGGGRNNDMNNHKMHDALSGPNIHPFKSTNKNPNSGTWNRQPVHRSWNGAINPGRPGINQYRPRPSISTNNNYDPHNWWHSVRNFPGGNRSPLYWRGHHYYYHDGNFFNIVDGIFKVVLPVVGFLVSTLPSGASQVNNYNNYYYYHGIYYTQTSNGYEVTNPPVGACVSELPYFAQEESINGQTYYTYDNIYLVPAYSSDGSICYEVVNNLSSLGY